MNTKQPLRMPTHRTLLPAYDLDMAYISSMYEAGYSFGYDVRLWSYTANAYVNSGGYEGGSGSNIMIPDAYRQSGERFRVDYYTDDGHYISSNDAEYP